MHPQRYRAVWLALLLSLLVSPAHAEYWPVQGLLNVSSPTIPLLKGSEEVDQVNRVWVQRMNDVSDRMAVVYGISTPKLLITKQSGPNAFVTMDKDKQPVLVMNTDMLRLVGDDDDLMAAVIGHEIGHLHGKHLTRGRAKAAVVGFLGALAGLIVDISQAKKGVDTGGLGAKLGGAGAQLVNAKFSRDQEREADDLGVARMASAGFNPAAAPRLWELMERQGGGGSGLWMSTHPSSSERHGTLTASAQTLQSTYLANAKQAGPSAPSEVVSMDDGSGSWSNIGENSYSYRFIDTASIRQTDAGTIYLVAYKYKNDKDKGFQHTAIADCPNKRRFVATQESDWTTRPFDDVVAGTLNAQELEAACLMASKQLQTPATDQVAGVQDHNRDGRVDAETPQTIRQVDTKTLKVAERAIAPIASLQPNSSTTATTSPDTSVGSTGRRLRELNDLKKEGLITQKEYLEKRKALISEL
ncbi:MAG: M48 family metalloprotease [Pseudomonadota bacterium]